ncbi:MAG: large conductance mechanosensitive channel protein MscL [Pseudomonadota bacterium]
MAPSNEERIVLKEFKEFAIKGNVTDMAVGIIIGAAFTTVVRSLVDDVIMPPLGFLMGGLDFADKFIVLRSGTTVGPYATLAQAKSNGATVLAYGNFINGIVAFLMVAGVLFFVVRWMNRLRQPETPAAPSTKICVFCKSAIDLNATRCAHCTSIIEEATIK